MASTGDQPPNLRLNSKQQLGELGSTFRARVEEKSLLLMKNRGLETGKSRFLSRPSHLLAQCPGVGCLTSSRLNFLICEMDRGCKYLHTVL